MDPNTPAEAVGGQPIDGVNEGIQTPVNDNPPPIDPPAYKYEEINGKTAAEIAREEAPKIEEKPIVEEKPPVDQEALNKQIAEDAAKAVLDQQKTDALAAEEARKAEENKPKTNEEKIYEDWAEKFNQENSRPPTYLEAMQFVEEQAITKIEQRQQAKQAEESKKADDAKEAQEEEQKRVNAFVDDEMADLYSAGKLTKIVDPNNPSDQGVVEKKSLFEKWAQVNNERRSKGLPDIVSATRIAEFYWKKPSAQVAGVDAPVMGSRSSSTPPDNGQNYTNADLKKPWSFWKR